MIFICVPGWARECCTFASRTSRSHRFSGLTFPLLALLVLSPLRALSATGVVSFSLGRIDPRYPDVPAGRLASAPYTLLANPRVLPHIYRIMTKRKRLRCTAYCCLVLSIRSRQFIDTEIWIFHEKCFKAVDKDLFRWGRERERELVLKSEIIFKFI